MTNKDCVTQWFAPLDCLGCCPRFQSATAISPISSTIFESTRKKTTIGINYKRLLHRYTIIPSKQFRKLSRDASDTDMLDIWLHEFQVFSFLFMYCILAFSFPGQC